jgi:hypothetical protein
LIQQTWRSYVLRTETELAAAITIQCAFRRYVAQEVFLKGTEVLIETVNITTVPEVLTETENIQPVPEVSSDTATETEHFTAVSGNNDDNDGSTSSTPNNNAGRERESFVSSPSSTSLLATITVSTTPIKSDVVTSTNANIPPTSSSNNNPDSGGKKRSRSSTNSDRGGKKRRVQFIIMQPNGTVNILNTSLSKSSFAKVEAKAATDAAEATAAVDLQSDLVTDSLTPAAVAQDSEAPIEINEPTQFVDDDPAERKLAATDTAAGNENNNNNNDYVDSLLQAEKSATRSGTGTTFATASNESVETDTPTEYVDGDSSRVSRWDALEQFQLSEAIQLSKKDEHRTAATATATATATDVPVIPPSRVIRGDALWDFQLSKAIQLSFEDEHRTAATATIGYINVCDGNNDDNAGSSLSTPHNNAGRERESFVSSSTSSLTTTAVSTTPTASDVTEGFGQIIDGTAQEDPNNTEIREVLPVIAIASNNESADTSTQSNDGDSSELNLAATATASTGSLEAEESDQEEAPTKKPKKIRVKKFVNKKFGWNF